MTPVSGGGSAPRKKAKGRPAVIDRDKIVAATRLIAPEKLTMQAVAYQLGVDPTALNYHVGGRDGLMRLAATDRLRMALDDEALASVEGPWQDVLRTFARMTRGAVASVGVLAKHVDLGATGLVPFLKVIDIAVGALKDAGFSEVDAGSAVGLISHHAVIAGRALIGWESGKTDGHDCTFGELGRDADQALPHVSALMAYYLNVKDSATATQEAQRQFEFGLDVAIRGLEGRLAAQVMQGPA
ncbi:TetR/AcrR family transcriptional regulator C-terminal domain-containing protein [Schaalia vaccimaxillae]|uniref:TetR/AcrR family transcriptional regulator C-terminal domain-containing protein n=1 Tax=Schaalia vaccimaxillae TaxID=183916 RepID=UPI0003B782C6|nr:TetR/AcrR family transcriptional regulator C-terminal domain-containing protein [Schaalia vaccimaxillae]